MSLSPEEFREHLRLSSATAGLELPDLNLPEAHHEHPARSTLLFTVVGVLFIWLVVGLAG